MKGAERNFALFILCAFLAVDGMIIVGAARNWSALVPDFFGFWSTARYLQTHPAAQAYDVALLGSYQHELRPDFTAVYPAPYSPIFLLLIRLLAWLPYSWAHLLWVATTLAAFAAAAWRVLAERAWVGLLLACPLIVLGAVYGQTGFLTAALMIGALRLMERQPWPAGLCLALLTFKPQLGLLMPVVLFARRDARTFLATAIWLAVLAGLSSALLGWSIWSDWLTTLSGHGALIAHARAQMLGIMTTVTSATLSLGGAPALAQALQILAALAVAAGVWIAWRRPDRDLALAATCVGSFLATPYAFVYDTPVAMCAAVVHLRHCRARGEIPLPDLLAALAVLVAPLFVLATPPQAPAAPLALLALFAAIMRRVLISRRQPDQAVRSVPPAPSAA